jgi:thiol-disulfide isomerase/thioredoxin
MKRYLLLILTALLL